MSREGIIALCDILKQLEDAQQSQSNTTDRKVRKMEPGRATCSEPKKESLTLRFLRLKSTNGK